MTIFKIATALLAALIVSGCAGNLPDLNEGSVRPAFEKAQSKEPIKGELFSKNPKGTIKKDGAFQINLISGYICDFREAGGIANQFAGSNRGDKGCRADSETSLSGVSTRGEVAITARFDILSSTDAQQEKGDRVIFFSPDVRETGQLFNFSNLPVYGPAKIPNTGSRLTLKILELDEEEGEHNAALLRELAALGATFASPLGGATFGTLVGLGSSLVESNQDDIEFSFVMGFDPLGIVADNSVLVNTIRPGYIVFLRKELRNDFTHFSDGSEPKLKICPEQGYISLVDDDCRVPYNRDTWLLLRVAEVDKETVNALVIGAALDVVRKGGLAQNKASSDALLKGLQSAVAERSSDATPSAQGAVAIPIAN